MKKLSLFLFAALFSFSAFSQLSSPITLGLHGGFVNTKGSTDYKSEIDSFDKVKEKADAGYSIGAFVRLNIKKTYIQTGLDYVSRKSEVKLPDIADKVPNSEILNEAVRVKSLDVPILIGYKLIKLPLIKARVFGGPVASFVIDDNIKKTFNSMTDDNESISAKIKTAVWNGKIGVGVDIWKLTLDVDYEFGISGLAKDIKSSQGKITDKIKQNMVNVTIGFKII
ncbi:MAG: PorT family protein [Marinifilaceae bacterium]|jgi:hypothetical protein|nr:PorT family protein [Marinifilaceae bacterium]